MPAKSYEDPRDALGFINNWRVVNSVASNRVQGNLILRQNPYLLLAGSLGNRSFPVGYHTWLPSKAPSSYGGTPDYELTKLELRLKDQCYTKLRGKLYEGSAALGVTLATVKQSREMVINRYQYLNRRCTEIAKDLIGFDGRNPRYSRSKHLEKLAAFHLEVIFGWAPLLADIHAATYTVVQLADVHTQVGVGASGSLDLKSGMDTVASSVRVSYSTTVSVRNPNLWLAERAGLLNPAVVAWDLVPWSFVVNMFVNVGQLVGSVTDFSGLSFSSTGLTTTKRYRAFRFTMTPKNGPVMGSWSGIDKRRVLTDIPKPPALRVRTPSSSWGTAAMAASLFTQRFSKLAGLVAAARRGRDVTS